MRSRLGLALVVIVGLVTACSGASSPPAATPTAAATSAGKAASTPPSPPTSAGASAAPRPGATVQATLTPLDLCTLVIAEEAQKFLQAARIDNNAKGMECVYDDSTVGSRLFLQQSRTARTVDQLRSSGLDGVDNKPW